MPFLEFLSDQGSGGEVKAVEAARPSSTSSEPAAQPQAATPAGGSKGLSVAGVYSPIAGTVELASR
jgi:hypothetical protein